MDQRQIFVRDVLTVLFKRKGFILGFLVLVVALVFVGNYVWPPTYESMAQVQVTRGREVLDVDPSVVQLGATSYPMMQLGNADVNTVVNLVYSNDVLKAAVEETGLDEGAGAGLIGTLRRTVRGIQYALRFKTRPDPVQEAADELRKNVEVDPVKDSYTIEIRCHMAKAGLAQDVLESVIAKFQDKYRDIHSTQELSTFFENELVRVSTELEEAQNKLRDFLNAHDIVDLDVQREMLVADYSDAKRLLDQLAETEAAAEEAAQTEAGTEEATASILSKQTESTVVTELQLRLLDKVVERNRMVNSLGPKHPQVQGIKNEITQLRDRLAEAISATRINTQQKIADIQGQMKNINEQLGALENLERNAELAGDNYEYYRKKLEESRVYDAMSEKDISSIRVTSAATLPDNPISPRRLFNLILALVGGLIGGVAIAFFLEYLDHGLKTPEDVEHYLELPPLASFFRTPYEQLDPKESERLSAMIGTVHGESPKMTAVTSSVPGEGAYRVARALAEAKSDDPEARTLLLDLVGDGVEEQPSGAGMLDVVEGAKSLDEVTARSGNLFVIGRGAQKGCPAYLWTSNRMRQTFEMIGEQYDAIIVNVAPVLASHDAVHMARYADGMLMVVKADSTRREVVQRAMDTLGGAEEKLLGAVLTERRQIIPHAVYRRI